MNFKEIHIGSLIEKRIAEKDIQRERICNFFQLSDEDIDLMLNANSIDVDMLLKWSKLLEYDFFRIYSQHLIFYSPASTQTHDKENSSLPQFRKNIYTQEVIDFILELVNTGKKTKQEIITEYNIPKTTLYKWIGKFKNDTTN
ncbi:transposase [Soonwooa sp.]|uniref:transposase n=1 Tax=Soonwooa sp. TaxID=1938592 RepID=UPI0026151D89|nr:transposase [Soonwooa sp.]